MKKYTKEYYEDCKKLAAKYADKMKTEYSNLIWFKAYNAIQEEIAVCEVKIKER
jgi:hypothetical protein